MKPCRRHRIEDRAALRALLALGLCLLAWPAIAETRVALVVGNSAYKTAPLKNPVNDARAMASRLRELGFAVVARENATRNAMGEAVAEFARKLTPGGVALIYYAGHGIQSRGRNYLIPVDAELAAESDLRFQAVDVTALTEEAEQAGSGVSFVILDACRNNPFERRVRGAARGLAAIDAARGTLIAYATAPGAVAADGAGENGIYTAALLRALASPGLKAEDVFKRARIEVADATRNQQVPWESSSLTGDFVFNIQVNVTVAPAAAPPGAAADREALFWQSIQASPSAADFQEYLKHYPQGEFAGLARNRIAALKQVARKATVDEKSAAPRPAQPAPAKRESSVAPAPPGAEELQLIDRACAASGERAAGACAAARGGDPAGVTAIAERYEDGSDLDKDNRAAVALLRWAVERGHALAERNLGLMYARGHGVAQDFDQALRLFRRAAAQDDPGGQYNLGVMYMQGYAVRRDDREAVRWYRLAAAQGHAAAQHNLALMYEHGNGTTQDHAEAMRLYRQAAAKGHALAMHNIGVLYLQGRGVTQDFAEGTRWLRDAAAKGSEDSRAALSTMCSKGYQPAC